MKFWGIQAAIGTAALLLSLPCEAKHGSHSQLELLKRSHSHKRLHASPRAESVAEEGIIEKRGSCSFPTNLGLVAVTPNESNGGWAMSPDQECTPGSYCPYACPCGQVAMQWDPSATSYPSLNGGLHCDSTGTIQKPISANPYCQDGTGSVAAQNECGSVVSFCQTVLPGNEAMLIPSQVDAGSTVTLAIPSMSYWLNTAAHYYVNSPGISTADACIWSDGSKPLGNWAPYVAGGNTDSSGNTFFKIGWNPIYTDSNFNSEMPDFGLKITCSGGECNGLPCSIDPSTDGIGGVTSSDQAVGAGGASFCVVTVPKGATANVVTFPVGSGGSSGSSSSSSKAAPTTSSSPTPTPTPTPSSTSTTSSTEPSTTSTSSSSILTTSSSSSFSSSSESSSTFSKVSSSSLFSHTTTSFQTSSSAYPTADDSPHVMFEMNATTTAGTKTTSSTGGAVLMEASATGTSASASASATKKSAAASTYVSGAGACLGLVFAFAAYFL